MERFGARLFLSAVVIAMAVAVVYFTYTSMDGAMAEGEGQGQGSGADASLPEGFLPDDMGQGADADDMGPGADADGIEPGADADGIDPEPDEVADDEDRLHVFREDATIFDFADLDETDFIRDMWSINQLIAKYGAPESAECNYFPGYDIVFTNVGFDGLNVQFWLCPAEYFSFYDDSFPRDGHEVFYPGEGDMDMELAVFALYFTKNIAGLPHGVKIGESTRQQIIEAYQEEPGYLFRTEEGYVYQIDYRYCFYNEQGDLAPEYFGPGRIAYLLDENDILYGAQVEYGLFDI